MKCPFIGTLLREHDLTLALFINPADTMNPMKILGGLIPDFSFNSITRLEH